MKLSSTGQNPCGTFAGNPDRDRRPCEGFSGTSATRPVASARAASRVTRDAVVRLAAFGSTATLGSVGFATVARSLASAYAYKPAQPRVAVLLNTRKGVAR
jgi:hypothetical protein